MDGPVVGLSYRMVVIKIKLANSSRRMTISKALKRFAAVKKYIQQEVGHIQYCLSYTDLDNN